MDPQRWEHAVELYHRACERNPAQRPVFLSEACAGDDELRREVESLLEHDVAGDTPLERVAREGAEWMPATDAPPASAVFQTPSAIGGYRILRLVGEGGMGVVYEAEQEHPRRIVALKVLKPGLTAPEMLRRFEQESQALARLQHPGIARIFEAGVADSGAGPQPYFAMEFIRGLGLLEFARIRQQSTRERLEIMEKVCLAVHHAHQRGIIHRDLKPANILVDESGQPSIVDFGVAHITESDLQATRHTDLGELVGTLAYMSPEQVMADPAELDARSDIYALGVVLYELLTGRLPYKVGRRLPEAMRAIREAKPDSLADQDRSFRGDIENIAAKALEKDKTRRYATAADLAADLRNHLTQRPIGAKPPSVAYLAAKLARRHRGLVAGGLAVLLSLIAGIVTTTRQAIRANRAEQEAKAVNEFLQDDLLAQVSAYGQASANNRPDPDLKVRTALDRAASRIAGRFDSQPLVEASIRHTIGNAYRNLGLQAEASRHMERALELRRRFLGPESIETSNSMQELGNILLLAGKATQAKTLFTELVAARRRRQGDRHRDTLGSMSDLANAYNSLGDYSRAASLYSEALSVQGGFLGGNHPDTLAVMNNLAAAYTNLGKYEQAAELYRQAVERKRSVLGADHPGTLMSLNSLGVAYRNQGKYAEAEVQLSAALEGRRRAMGHEHPDTLVSMNSLALLYQAAGRFEEAQSLLKEVLDLRRRIIGADHPDTIRVAMNLAELYRRTGRDAEAEPLLAKVIEARRRVLGPRHPSTLAALASMGGVKLAQRRFAQALPLLHEAVNGYQEINSDRWLLYHAQSLLGACFAALGMTDEARPLLRAGYEGLLNRQDSIPAENRSVLSEARERAAQVQ